LSGQHAHSHRHRRAQVKIPGRRGPCANKLRTPSRIGPSCCFIGEDTVALKLARRIASPVCQLGVDRAFDRVQVTGISIVSNEGGERTESNRQPADYETHPTRGDFAQPNSPVSGSRDLYLAVIFDVGSPRAPAHATRWRRIRRGSTAPIARCITANWRTTPTDTCLVEQPTTDGLEQKISRREQFVQHLLGPSL
jgi:hypothetical protein